MFFKVIRSRAVARGAIAVLAVGVSLLAGLALWSTSATQRATSRVSAVNERGVYWGQLFDHVNLEEDMMNAYVGALNDAQRAAFVQTIGGAEPILTTLRTMGDAQDRLMATQATDAYHDYTVALRTVLAVRSDPADLKITAQRGASAADAVLQLVSASLANDRQQTRIFNRAIDAESRRARVATTIAFAACLCLLVVCSAVLLSYQRRVERQADTHRHDSLHDALTGLPNRTLLADRASAAIRAAAQHGNPVGMLLIDLNGFKQVNDTLGHRYGDLLLQQVATRLGIAVRDGDTVARIGGDEFAVLLPRISSVQEATEIAGRVLAVLRQPVGLDDHTLEISGSIGVAVCPTHSDSTEHLLQHADVAMYTAKRGRLGVQVYSPQQSVEYPQQLTLLADLRHALEVDALTVHYQPQVNLGTGRIYGVEALARWHHPVYGVIGPAEFIPVAEDGGLIDQLTRRILTEALGQCRQWRHDGLRLPIAVNLSARCLIDPGLLDTVATLLRENEIPPGMLTLEITESSAIEHREDTIDLLLALRRLGVRLSLDDFGTGNASMTQLQQLPVDELKIDRCFVSRLTGDPTSRAIVRTIVELARDLDLDVVAEGVEDQPTHDELDSLGCLFAQGYLFSEPLPAVDLAACITRLGTTDERVSRGFVTSPVGQP
jgi:diguanylate cyclase (GGDEF)-like protein